MGEGKQVHGGMEKGLGPDLTFQMSYVGVSTRWMERRLKGTTMERQEIKKVSQNKER